jgi:hypothetical protein
MKFSSTFHTADPILDPVYFTYKIILFRGIPSNGLPSSIFVQLILCFRVTIVAQMNLPPPVCQVCK